MVHMYGSQKRKIHMEAGHHTIIREHRIARPLYPEEFTCALWKLHLTQARLGFLLAIAE
jgi:hypothetical protein